ncbi:hypothetical protein CDO52_00635 [Nocardiopsis gilva YIM 90087]|uniref:Uncharacterized protein n=1 Tax=Nocardiopsis gilva YIM 90087 TaxID=1235441 RepID=A0A223S035_9ACTN|nr:hypothetical protein [Nocardiopsis gilva]ASU81485.1 hypothetical protein CDO52_00635 [Nocardiopsis gilva YIM 90087]
MTTVRTDTADTLAELKAWAAYHDATITVVDYWDAVTFRADVVSDDGVLYRYLYREEFPPPVALKRRRNTFTVECVHEPAGALCFHVRVVTPQLSDGELVDPAYLAELVAVATIQRERRLRCGATAENLMILTTTRTYAADHASYWGR